MPILPNQERLRGTRDSGLDGCLSTSLYIYIALWVGVGGLCMRRSWCVDLLYTYHYSPG